MARFPISQKPDQNTLLEDTNSGQGGVSRLGSAYSTFQPSMPREGSKKSPKYQGGSHNTMILWKKHQKNGKFVIFLDPDFGNLIFAQRDFP